MSVQYRQDLSDDIASGRLKLPGPTIPGVPVDRATSKEIKRLVGKIEKLLDERDALIRRARDEGASLREIAELLHVNHVTVKNLLAEPSVRRRGPTARSSGSTAP